LGGFCKHGDGTSGSIKKASYCLTSWVTIRFWKKNPSPWSEWVSEWVSK
jgi:hypothetical protein